MKKQHLVIPLILALFFTIPLAVHAQEAEMMEAAPVEQASDEVLLNIEPTELAQMPDTEMLFTVTLTPGQYSVKAVDLALTFDPQFVEIVDAGKTAETEGFTELTKTIDNETGSLLFSLGIPLGAADTALLTKAGAVATISARTKAIGSTTLGFDKEKTVVAVKEKEVNAAGFTTGGANITIQGDQADTTEDAAADPVASPLIPFLIPALLFIIGLGIYFFFFMRKK